MKIEFLEKIVGKIQHEIGCPKCKNIFAKGSIEICSVTSRRLEFSSRCHICGATAQIVADINVQEKDGTSSPKVPGFINPNKVQQITQRLSHFNGKDVGELFQ